MSPTCHVQLRDGLRGPSGPPGPQGKKGAAGPQGKQGAAGPKSGGATYTRWRKSTCPRITGTEEVYSGITAGSNRLHSGSGSNNRCMSKVPEYNLSYSSSEPLYKAFLYGAKYEYPLQGSPIHNVPYAVCHVSTRSAVLMIPGNTTCPPT